MLCSVRSQLALCGLLCLAVLAIVIGVGFGAEPAAPPKEVTDSIGMKLILVPAGKFVMGSPKDEKDRDLDEAQHEVEITKPFYLGAYTVTVGQFRQFVKDAGYQTEAEKDGQGGAGYAREPKISCSRSRSTTGKTSAGSRPMTTR